MSKKISVVVLNYRHPQDTTSCLRSLAKTDLGGKAEYYVVDNSPVKQVEVELKKSFPKLNYIASSKNLGFAAGNNQAIRVALKKGSDYVLIINPDVTVSHNFFVPLLKHFAGKEVGLVAPIIYHTQKDKKVYGLDGKVDWHLAKPEHGNVSSIKGLKPVSSEFVTFACVLISKETFKKAGLLDENYFMYFEDVDYCLTARKQGIKIVLEPAVVVSHHTSSSFKRPTQKLLISFVSHLYFIKKWLSPLNRVVPYLYALTLYPYLYILWSYHGIKYKNDTH